MRGGQGRGGRKGEREGERQGRAGPVPPAAEAALVALQRGDGGAGEGTGTGRSRRVHCPPCPGRAGAAPAPARLTLPRQDSPGPTRALPASRPRLALQPRQQFLAGNAPGSVG